MKSLFFAVVLILQLSFNLAVAQESKTDIQVASPEAQLKLREALRNKKFSEDKDITDAKLQAEAGSVSRYSLKFNLSYYGPVMNDLSNPDQPNPDKSNRPIETAISGSLGGRLRLSPDTSISVGSGLKAVHPFAGMERVDLNDPFLSYDMMNRIGDLQMRNSPGLSYVTTPNYVRTGEYGSISHNASLVYNFGTSHWAVGTDFNFGYYLYSRAYRPSDNKANNYSLSLSPNLKYNFSDKLSVNTSVGLAWWNARSNSNAFALWNMNLTQRLGLGYGITRDIYIAPYLSFYPSRLAMDMTTFNVATIFSVL